MPLKISIFFQIIFTNDKFFTTFLQYLQKHNYIWIAIKKKFTVNNIQFTFSYRNILYTQERNYYGWHCLKKENEIQNIFLHF